MARLENKDDNLDSRDTLINVIANSLNRAKASDKTNTKTLLMLIAALGLLNLSKDSDMALAVARKLSSTLGVGKK